MYAANILFDFYRVYDGSVELLTKTDLKKKSRSDLNYLFDKCNTFMLISSHKHCTENEEILNGKLLFLCSECFQIFRVNINSVYQNIQRIKQILISTVFLMQFL